MTTKPRLLAIGHGREGFGFGRVLGALLPRLAARYDLHQFELGVGESAPAPWPVLANQIPWDLHGEEQLPGMLERVRPDVVLVLSEVWNVGRFARLVERCRPRPGLVAYCPVDGELIPGDYLDGLAGVDRLAAYNAFGRDQIARALAGTGRPIPPIDLVPHGVDRTTFRPLDGDDRDRRRAARRAIFPDRPELADAFVVLNANRNQPRKRVDLTIEGFAAFARGRPDAYLCLHMGKTDRGANIHALARRHGIEDRLLRPTRDEGPPRVGVERLNLIYNACDVGLNTSMGEAWGLVGFEHAATRAAQVVPAHGAVGSLWAEGAASLLPGRPCALAGLPLRLAEVAPADVAEHLGRLHDNRSHLERQSAAAFQNASRPEFTWDAAADRLDGTLRLALDDPAAARSA